MARPLVSVVIPAYNAAGFIGETLDSVRAQTVRDLEVLVVDDGSTDGTAGLVRRRYPEVRLFTQANQGAAVARNTALDHARGDWIAFLDSDDLWQPAKLERQLAHAERNREAAVVHTGFRYLLPDGSTRPRKPRVEITSGRVLGLLWEHYVIQMSTAMVRGACLGGGFRFDPRFPPSEDLHFFLRLAFWYPFAYLDEPLGFYRDRPDSISADMVRLCRSDLRARLAFVEEFPRAAAELGASRLQRHFQDKWSRLAAYQFWARDLGGARESYLRAWRCRPVNPRPLGGALLSALPAAQVERLAGWRHRLRGHRAGPAAMGPAPRPNP
jgi:glycosyltransferase involved in cell wall biosynthesis